MASKEIILRGVPICRGIAIGKPFFVNHEEEVISDDTVPQGRIEDEVQRYQKALDYTRDDLLRLQKQMEQEDIQEGAKILEAQLEMMQDPELTQKVEKEIRLSHRTAEYCFQSVIKLYQQRFNAIDNPFFRERFREIQDISRRVIGHLHAGVRVSLASVPPNSIVFSRELAAGDTAEAHAACASAFITELGGATSHAAIVAKARGTPYVSSIPLHRIAQEHALVIVDGRTGEIILSPSPKTLDKYQAVHDQLKSHMLRLNQSSTLASETLDGYRVRLSANIETASELEILHQHGGHGVGLFRSEYLCLSKDSFPGEEEQYQVYRELVEKMRGLPIVIRTFDIGGDKGVPHHHRGNSEQNPFLGCRAIRFMLKEREIFTAQLRAILRASAHGDVSVMFPMVSTLSELVEAKAAVFEVQRELDKKKIPYGRMRIGCMIEVPSAAIIADLLAKECDFLSIGTNDLVQYALAVDRGNHAMNALYTPTHPSVIRMIKLIVQEANHQGIPVTVCGEVAADPRFTPLLLGLGVHELSVATRYLPAVKDAIRRTSIVAASELAEVVLTLGTAQAIQELLAEEYRANAPDDCFYNC